MPHQAVTIGKLVIFLNIVKYKYILFTMDMKGSELCPRVEAAFGLLAKKWAGLIVLALLDGALYFSELEAAIPPISARVLSLRMRELELEGLVSRDVSSSSPPRVSYALTTKGEALAIPIRGIANWARAWMR